MTTAITAAWLTPPQVAEQLAVDAAKVLTWIQGGELAAVNVATRVGGRPRWRISQVALEAFLVARQSTPPADVPPKARRPTKRAYREFV